MSPYFPFSDGKAQRGGVTCPRSPCWNWRSGMGPKSVWWQSSCCQPLYHPTFRTSGLQGQPAVDILWRQHQGQTASGNEDSGKLQHTQGLIHQVWRPVLRAWGACCALGVSVYPCLFLALWGTPCAWQLETMARADKKGEAAAERNPEGTQFWVPFCGFAGTWLLNTTCDCCHLTCVCHLLLVCVLC